VSQLLTCAYQATKHSSERTFEAAKELTQFLGANFLNWSVDDVFESYTSKIEEVMEEHLTWENDDITLQNIQARARSPIIWMLANIKNAILLVTSNRSEGDVGYSTMDGDTSGSLAPIAGIDKPFIRKWLVWAEKSLGIEGLSGTNQLVPTAELRPSENNQSDEDDLMPYDIMLRIERLAIRDHQSPIETYQNLINKNIIDSKLLKSHVIKFFEMWSKNQWKRERTAPSFHLDDFNIDPRTWCRFPILSSGFKDEIDELIKMP
jgi:NAD+ synthase (glutamine-hydrolysing)